MREATQTHIIIYYYYHFKSLLFWANFSSFIISFNDKQKWAVKERPKNLKPKTKGKPTKGTGGFN